MRDTVDKLRQEEEELERAAFGAPVPEETTEDTATENQVEAEETHVEAKELVTPDPQPATDEQHDTQREDWEKRYKNLRASRDDRLAKTKSQLSAALETINSLQMQIRELQSSVPTVDPLEGVFTEEDTEQLGEATVDALRKVTKKATEAVATPLRKKLEEQEKHLAEQRKLRAKQESQEAYSLFLGRIARAVPEWEEINVDPNFAKYMEKDDIDGTPRKSHFQSAEGRLDALTVIKYMREYQAATAKPKDQLAKKVTPVGDGAGANQPVTEAKEKRISKAFIEKFYDDLTRGRYAGRHSEALEIERKIDEAVAKGLILM